MANIVTAVAEAGAQLGLPPRPGKPAVFGAREGHLIQLAASNDGSTSFVLVMVRYGDATRDAAVREALENDADLAAASVKARAVDARDGVAIYRHVAGLTGVGADALAAEMRAIHGAVKRACPAPLARCCGCGGDAPDAPVLLNALVARVCAGCLANLEAATADASAAYDAASTNWVNAGLAAALLAAAGAVAWAGIAVATNRMFWLIAIGIGAVIGLGTTKAAGKGGLGVQLLGGAATLASVLAGQVALIGWTISEIAKASGESVDWLAFGVSIPSILFETGGDTLFALGGGLIGAWQSARFGAKPQVGVTVERQVPFPARPCSNDGDEETPS